MPKPDLRCYVATAAGVVAGRWKAAIVWHLLRDSHYYGELRRLIPGASQRMMTLSLRDLERDGVVGRVETAKGRVRHVRYELTPLGRTLEAVVESLFEWGKNYRVPAQVRRLPLDIPDENAARTSGNRG